MIESSKFNIQGTVTGRCYPTTPNIQEPVDSVSTKVILRECLEYDFSELEKRILKRLEND